MGFAELWTNWIVIAIALLGISTVIAALIYMLSGLLENEKMKGWAKIELTEVFYSALIISMAIVGLGMINSVVQGSLLGTPATGMGTPGCAGSLTSYWIPVTDKGAFNLHQRYECLDICGSAIAASKESVYNGVESCHIRLGIWYLREIFDEAKTFAF
ncbi:MAG: hypothetical protein ACOY58_01390, partial [Candidatus Micrarchaeota archaeon]